MNLKDVGKISGAIALAIIPAAGGLYAYGKMKDKRNSTGVSALVGGLTATVFGVGVALLNYYLLGLDEASVQISSAIDSPATVGALLRPRNIYSSAGGRVGALPSRVYDPFTNDIHKLGLLNIQRGSSMAGLGMLNVQRRVGCCGR